MSIIKRKQLLKTIVFINCMVLISLVSLLITNKYIELKNSKINSTIIEDNAIKTTEFALETIKKPSVPVEEVPVVEEVIEPVVETPPAPASAPVVVRQEVYDGLTMEELSAKLDRSLGSKLAGKGNIFATHCIELGIDPYLAVAIVLQETGCKWKCSNLVQKCNNIGGQKGSGCDGFQYYNTIDEGIIGFIDNLYRNYFSKGLNTPEKMNTKYAESTTWSVKVNNYIEKIKAS